jgi:predicted metalloprotease with PDZ domain
MRRNLLAVLALSPVFLAAAADASAQPRSPAPRISVMRRAESSDDDRAMLGISTTSDGKRDTLGVLIASITPGSPVEKAGIEEGNRIASINGVSLKLAREDAGEPDMSGTMTRRLTREMRKVKAGDEVSLEVYAGGRYRTVKVKTVAADDLRPMKQTWADEEERAVLGVSLSSSGSKRDTAGVFVQSVTEDGPAEKAGITEGDRIANVNGVDLRTPKEDVGDGWVSSSRVQRLQREVRKLKPGQTVDLTVVTGGRARTVKVTVGKAKDLRRDRNFGFSIGEGDGFFAMLPMPPGAPMAPMAPHAPGTPRVRIFRDGGDFNFEFDGERLGEEIGRELRIELPRAMDEVRRSMEKLRIEAPLMKARLLRTITI